MEITHTQYRCIKCNHVRNNISDRCSCGYDAVVAHKKTRTVPSRKEDADANFLHSRGWHLMFLNDEEVWTHINGRGRYTRQQALEREREPVCAPISPAVIYENVGTEDQPAWIQQSEAERIRELGKGGDAYVSTQNLGLRPNIHELEGLALKYHAVISRCDNWQQAAEVIIKAIAASGDESQGALRIAEVHQEKSDVCYDEGGTAMGEAGKQGAEAGERLRAAYELSKSSAELLQDLGKQVVSLPPKRFIEIGKEGYEQLIDLSKIDSVRKPVYQEIGMTVNRMELCIPLKSSEEALEIYEMLSNEPAESSPAIIYSSPNPSPLAEPLRPIHPLDVLSNNLLNAKVRQAFENIGLDVECKACMNPFFNGVHTSDHTCENFSEQPITAEHDLEAGQPVTINENNQVSMMEYAEAMGQRVWDKVMEALEKESPLLPEKLYVVGKGYAGNWELMGVFSTPELAAEHCPSTVFWYAEIELDKLAPVEPTPFPNIHFPRREEQSIDLTQVSQAWAEGYAARRRGEQCNPYASKHTDYPQWVAGWKQADIDLTAHESVSCSEAFILTGKPVPYIQGWESRKNQVTLERNPYTKGLSSTLFERWQSGWLDCDNWLHQEHQNTRILEIDHGPFCPAPSINWDQLTAPPSPTESSPNLTVDQIRQSNPVLYDLCYAAGQQAGRAKEPMDNPYPPGQIVEHTGWGQGCASATPLKNGPTYQRCRYDTDGDGNCERCHNRGGCQKIGGPYPLTPEETAIWAKPIIADEIINQGDAAIKFAFEMGKRAYPQPLVNPFAYDPSQPIPQLIKSQYAAWQKGWEVAKEGEYSGERVVIHE